MADLVGCVKEIGKCILTQWILPPVKSHFDYWWCLEDNINGLRDGIRNLERRKHYIEQKREEARLLTHILCPGVEEWLNASTVKLEKAQKILLPDHNIPKAWNLISRYSLGKNAKKTAQEIEIFRNEGDFNPIADSAPPAAMASPCHRPTMEFESRKSIEKDIVDCLQKSTVGMIVICGMGGVGKTTMAEIIRERVKEEDLFDEVVKVTVSQTMDMPKIQNEIAELLGLKFDVESISARAHKLSTRLMDRKKKIIILDDVWDNFRSEDLGILGIPMESNFEMCKVLLTSRCSNACKEIKNKKVFNLKILEEDEAWLLFKDKAGDCAEGFNCVVAKQVAAECKGLPIALVTVGLGLRDITDIHTWENSLSQLRKANPEDFSEVLRDVYNPLKLSYDFLESDRERSLFLLCCLFPEDFNISVELLTWYSMGLGLFHGVKNIKEARNRTHTLVGKLQSRFLLIDVEMDGKKGLEVKMHDVIRDVAIYIGSIEKDGFLKSLTSIENSSDVNCNWMSVDISNEQMEVPVLSRFPKLRLLILLKLSCNQFSDISFEGMKGVNVLSFQSISIRSLPPTLGALENLQTLRMFHCEVQNISVIGKLTSLKILSCCECQNITELPAEIGRLKGLRYLELNRCRKLQRIPFGIISSLFLLEELKICFSFSEWETGGERRNASLTELEGLRNLTCLEIEISDCTLSAQDIRLSQKLVRYRICIAPKGYYDFEDICYEKVMILNLSGAVGNWIQLLARNAESLSLSGDGSDHINLAEMENLRKLKFSECSTMKKLVDTSYLIQNVSLCNLKSISICGCSNLKHVFSASVARTRLRQLKILHIENCAAMEQVFWNEGTNDNTYGCIEFPKLKKLRLLNLPNLTAFCGGLDNIIIKFPNLKHTLIRDLPKLISLCPPNSETVENTCFHLFCNPKYLLQLEDLSIRNCESMEQVFWNEIKDNNTYGCIKFPKLKKLRLQNLPNLTAFCRGLDNIIIKFPNLTQLWIRDLPKLISLSPPNSETVENTCFHLFCNPKVEMFNLKDMMLFGSKDTNIRNIWCSQIPNNFFNNLKTLRIYYMNDIRRLISTSIAKNIVSLKYLCISDCEEMVEVIEIDDDNNKEVVDINCLFPNLKSLEISHMPKLKRFWQWNHALELPLLEEMKIYNCPAMETFTLGSVNTPNIRKISVNLKNIKDHKDLNDVIHNIWTECQASPKLRRRTRTRRTRMKLKMSTTMRM